jgi:hypothetical protein
MPTDIKYLLVFLIIALIVLIYLQNQQCSVTPNEGSLTRHRTESNPEQRIQRNLSPKDPLRPKTTKSIDNNTQDNSSLSSSSSSNTHSTHNTESTFENPLPVNVNPDRYITPDVDQTVLNKLMMEVNNGNTLPVNSRQNEIFGQKSNSINKAKNGYRKVSYADSEYRSDFNGTREKNGSSELDKLYNDSLIFNNNENSLENNKFEGYPDMNVNFTRSNNEMNVRGYLNSNEKYDTANLKDFSPSGPQSQKDKVLRLYDSEEYLPNDKLLNNDLTKGFQILENPVSVKNPNLIPVLKSIPVSSVLGSKRNSTWDIRSEPPNPKTVVSPFLNSSIMPDIYATNRGCL